MAFSEEYFIHLEGEQKGPYTFPQVKNLYENHLIPEEALYWRDGMEQLGSVAELCGRRRTDRLRHLKQLRITGIVVVAGLVLIFIRWAPLLRDGWRENNERADTSWAAYWRARGFVRDKVKRDGDTVAFEPFASATITLSGSSATVILPSTVYTAHDSGQPRPWKVEMQYDSLRADWRLPGN